MSSIHTKEKIFHETSIERKGKSREKSSIPGTRRNHYKCSQADSWDLTFVPGPFLLRHDAVSCKSILQQQETRFQSPGRISLPPCYNPSSGQTYCFETVDLVFEAIGP